MNFFEENVEERRLDPVSAITEVMSRLKEGEAIWLQLLIKPVSDKWKKGGEEIRDKIMQRKKDKKKGPLEEFADGIFHFFRNLTKGAVEPPDWPEKKKSEEKLKMLVLSPGEREVLERVEAKIAKLGFESMIRFVYIDKKDSFTPMNVSAVTGAFKQFNTQNLNSFKMDGDTRTAVTDRKFTTKSWFRKKKIYFRKRKIFDWYKLRGFSSSKPYPVLNAEELATIFHFPITSVGAPLLRRLETRKGEPPHGLPIE
ncbi:MAG: hypothetical protein PHN74_00540 [Candidatus Pacebacteria bacterium]|nr:hypothetical protein [Candidatus Paceibacterota bacterium]